MICSQTILVYLDEASFEFKHVIEKSLDNKRKEFFLSSSVEIIKL